MALDFDTKTVNYSIEGRVAHVEMNRPESLNALNVEMIHELAAVMKELSNLEEIDIVVLKGAGRAFSSGGDIKTMLMDANENDFPVVMDAINELVVTLYSMPKITISAIKGAAAGLGLSLALATDFIYAHKDSKLAMNFIGIGLIPDGGSHFFLESKLGPDQAKHLIWEGKPMTAEEAWERGLVHEVVGDDLDEAVNKKVYHLSHLPILAMIKTKKILTDKNRPLLLKLLELEKSGQAQMRKTADHKEGINAFIEKRQPRFTGK